jgi:hypothetical protein
MTGTTSILFFCISLSLFFFKKIQRDSTPIRNNYYISTGGDDNNDGSELHPFKTIMRLQNLHLTEGDTVFFKSGDIFKGTLQIDSSKSGAPDQPVVFTSYGKGNAVVDGGNGDAIIFYNTSFICLSDLTCKGTGRENGNTKSGLSVINCKGIKISNVDISGFQKSGLLVYNCQDLILNKIDAHENGAAGITVEGDYHGKSVTRNITIQYCKAINNPGDPTNLTNHSGDGIVAGHCTHVLIDHCMATNNGWDMPRIGNGPVGIWCYEADSVIIQHCLSYKNKTSRGGADGGGFDLDGGVTHSIVQYCLSYENQGSGYCMFQYWGATPWHDNIIRFNISIDDGHVSDSRAGAYVWNSSGDEDQFYNCDFYNNTIYNNLEAALSYSDKSKRKNFRFFNNIFVAKDSLIKGNKGEDVFLANDWWSIERKFNTDGAGNFRTWAKSNDVEIQSGKIVGLNLLPPFKKPGVTTFKNVNKITDFDNYKISPGSLLAKSGIDLKRLFHLEIGDVDFNGAEIKTKYLGACTSP